VHIKRSGGAYLARRERQQRLQLMSFAAGGLMVSVAAGLAVNPYVGLLTGLAAGSMAGPALDRLRRVRAGRLRKTGVTAVLARLSDEYYLVSDVAIPGHRGKVDHVLIGPCGVVVITAKRWSGRIRVTRDRLTVNRLPRMNVIRELAAAAAAVNEFLVRAHPELRGSLLRWVETAVVVTHPSGRVSLDRPWHPVMHSTTFRAFLEAKPRRAHYTAALGEMLAAALSDGAEGRAVLSGRVLSAAS
jgi:hypothetical protein